jgi:putative transcriptional regulator
VQVIENRVSELLGRRRESIADLARATGISYPACHALYHGSSKSISFDVMEKLCAYFGCQPGELFVYVPEPEPA